MQQNFNNAGRFGCVDIRQLSTLKAAIDPLLHVARVYTITV